MNIVINRGLVTSLEDLPPYSIALDGRVKGPKIDNKNHRYSLDHHDGCYRYCTKSATSQAWVFINGGFDPEPYTIYVNDVDIDVNGAIYCFSNPDKCKDSLIKKLVDAIALGDEYLGALDYVSNGMVNVVKWIAAPELEAKRKEDYNKISDEGLRSIMEAVLHRIDLYADGKAQEEIHKYEIERKEYKKTHIDYTILQNFDSWVVVDSHNPHVFSSLFKAGFDRVVVTRTLPDGSLFCSIAKKMDFTDAFDLDEMVEDLKKLELVTITEKYKDDLQKLEAYKKCIWGGGTTVKGAPNYPDGSRSSLKLEQVVNIIKKHA